MLTVTNPVEVLIDDHPVGIAYEVEMRDERPVVAYNIQGLPAVERVHRSIYFNKFKEYK